MKTPRFAAGPGFWALLSLAGPLAASATPSVSGSVVLVAPPPSVDGVFTGNTTDAEIWLFQEQASIELSEDVDVEQSEAGTTVTGSGSGHVGATPDTIAAGTVVEVWFLHHRPNGNATNTGSVTFESDILGVILGDTTLSDSDVLGAPGTTYPTGQGARGTTEPGSNPDDSVTLSADRRTLDISSLAGGFQDQIRVLLVPVPEPSSAALVLLGMALLARTRRA